MNAPDAFDLPDVPVADHDDENRPVREPKYLGSLRVGCIAARGKLDLDVMQAPDLEWIEVGPFRMDTHQAQRLLRWLCEHVALADAHRWVKRKPAPLPISGAEVAGPSLARNLAGLCALPPWEGETLP